MARSLFFLPLTQAFQSVTNRRKTSSLVVSLLTNCQMQSASEAAVLPGRAGLLCHLRALSCNTPPTPGGENEPVFTSFLFSGELERLHMPASLPMFLLSIVPAGQLS